PRPRPVPVPPVPVPVVPPMVLVLVLKLPLVVPPPPPPRERCAEALICAVGKNPARACATIAAACRNVASAAFRFWFEMSICCWRPSSTGSWYTDHHCPRSLTSAGRATCQLGSVLGASLYAAGTTAAGR